MFSISLILYILATIINIGISYYFVFVREKKVTEQITQKIMHSISGSTNYHKGRLGELIAYLKLNSEYNILLPLHDIVDFIGIKFPTDKQQGVLHFIDIKNGHDARLTKNQRTLKTIVKKKNISFITMHVNTQVDNDTEEKTNQDTGSKPISDLS